MHSKPKYLTIQKNPKTAEKLQEKSKKQNKKIPLQQCLTRAQ